jgi:exopolyphosphatase/guanosine-5'-triphosphate,3'-diphosphate pyrophosphatase
MRVAAIDCGTNSIRLLIADVDPAAGTLVDVVREMKVVRLGEGVDRTGELSPAALQRTFDALAEYVVQIRVECAHRVRMVATSATRDASNRDEFVSGVRALLGEEPEIIPGSEEARLSFLGATGELRARPDLAPPYLVVDIGGGSTEFILGDAAGSDAIVASRSVNMGCVRLAERHLASDPPTPEQLEAVRRDALAGIAEAAQDVDLTAAHTLVAVAGTATTVAALGMGLPQYDPERIHLSTTALADVERVTAELGAMNHEQRAALGPMHPGRVDVIVSGATILREVVRAVGTGSMIASEHDILDGIALDLARRPR